MNRNIIWVLVFTLWVGCTQKPVTLNDLEAAIRGHLTTLDGDFALVFKNLDDSTQHININQLEMFHAASTMKTPVMIELFKQAEEGRFSLMDSIKVKNEFRSIVDSSRYEMDISEDSEGELYKLIEQQRTIRDLIDDMITMSSNLATNILIEQVGAANVTETMRSYGADSILVLRGVEDIKAFEMGLSNRTNAHDEAVIYEKLATGQAVSEEASSEMIEILKQQKFNEMIPARLPDDAEVAHKTGWITGVNHDCGIVFLPDGRKYVLVMLSKNAPNREEVLSTFADISRTIYDFVSE
jgi:beta-lactamase class A